MDPLRSEIKLYFYYYYYSTFLKLGWPDRNLVNGGVTICVRILTLRAVIDIVKLFNHA